MNFPIHPFSITTSPALWVTMLLESIPAVLQDEGGVAPWPSGQFIACHLS